jgi:hypothetical protein
MIYGKGWGDDGPSRRFFFGWLNGVNKLQGTKVDYEAVKARLGVKHLGEYTGTLADAQKAVLDLVEEVKATQPHQGVIDF